MLRSILLAVTCLVLAAQPSFAAETSVARSFAATTVAEREAALAGIRGDASDAARMALAAHRAFGALEQFSQDLYLYGFHTPQSMMVPLMRLPVPENPTPEELSYQQWRSVLEALDSGLGEAIAMLEALPAESDAAFEVDLRTMRFDMNGDGDLAENESIGAILAAFANPGGRRNTLTDGDVPPPVFRFDRADAYWLQGYANFLRANIKMWLAHDFHMTFDSAFQLFFPRAGMQIDLPVIDRALNLWERMRNASGEERAKLYEEYNALSDAEKQRLQVAARIREASGWGNIFDLISFIHTINWPVEDKAARAAVRTHVLEMIRLSRLSWKAIEAETDNDREWLPGPQQPGRHPLTRLTITAETVTAWHDTLEIMERALNGEALIPHPRFPGYGVNLKRFFEEPETFDLVMTITGPGVLPYLEQGEILDQSVWNRTTRSFGRGNFFSYAVWIN